jgi:glycine dehydrogenase
MNKNEVKLTDERIPHMLNSDSGQRSIPAHPDVFMKRHIGPSQDEVQAMLQSLALADIDELTQRAVPSQIRAQQALNLPPALSEYEALQKLKRIAQQNQVFRSYIGQGFHNCIIPQVIQRNILENPGWYTQYTPYQSEIAQGRLEAQLNFQTMVCDLTGLDIANASLLDEATAAAEAMTMCRGLQRGAGNCFFVSQDCHPQTIAVVSARARPLGIEVALGDHREFNPEQKHFGALLQYPSTDGEIHDYREFITKIHELQGLVVVATDLLALTLIASPGEIGADVAVGSAQRFGTPLGFGGPHAAFFSTRDKYKRQIPGRIVGVSKDLNGRPALRLSIQTREQHIRREKATSNICTAQALMASLAAMYAIYHGPHGLQQIAARLRLQTLVLAHGLRRLGFRIRTQVSFDTICIQLESQQADQVMQIAARHRINLRRLDAKAICIALDETVAHTDIMELWQVFNEDQEVSFTVEELTGLADQAGFGALSRTSAYLTHSVFNRYHSETELLRYLRRLEGRDLSLTMSMIPLGSCTMKLNPTTAMVPISWPEFNALHPYAPESQSKGYRELIEQLSTWLAEITGFQAVSLQPNAGSQGEYAGLLAIKRYQESRTGAKRDVCLIPSSAHGTNPASAVMAGLKVSPIACDEEGNISLKDLRARVEQHGECLAAIMITYPSTHGVFEDSIKEVCRIIHDHGGLVYMDGANMNAQVGLCKPQEIGADVCHLNLHKTFGIPHGGGGPGVGPICVTEQLRPFLPGDPCQGPDSNAVAATRWGSASILPISWSYIAMLGAAGLKRSTQIAILNANYIAQRLESYYPVLYKGSSGLVAHELILDLRSFKYVTVEDVAKRLMDYGFHAPTISWPVAGAMMVEPTESESREELDRFCAAMIKIHAEIMDVESGRVHKTNNLLKNAPHNAEAVVSDDWRRPYSREQAAYPETWIRQNKFWPAVGRVDNVYGDRNLMCSCIGMQAYS